MQNGHMHSNVVKKKKQITQIVKLAKELLSCAVKSQLQREKPKLQRRFINRLTP